ncbi:MAG: hypothetical protein QOK24_2161 [Verrucomicrobiota bacterium]|jgi:hypothetical protein
MNKTPATAAFRLRDGIIASKAGAIRAVVIVLLVLIVIGAVGFYALKSYLLATTPIDYADITEQWKYGSIGSDVEGLPFKIWRVLPDVFGDKLPGKGYESIGLIFESGRETPIGVSMRNGAIPLVGLNCAVCHTGTVRESSDKAPLVLPAMPSHQLNLGEYFNFLFACAGDPRFTSDNLLAAMEKKEKLSVLEKFVYPNVVKQMKEGVLKRSKALEYLKSRPPMGPGRVDTFNPYKVLFFGKDMTGDQSIGTVDFPAVWDQETKKALFMHWDGNNNSIDERNISASLGAGASPKTVDFERLNRIKEWLLALPSPKYPFQVDPVKVASGKALYAKNCASCHQPGSSLFGQVTPVAELGTDPHRVDAFTDEMVTNMNSLGTGYPWRFSHFRKTNGYVNRPLDGIWARAPYLHNGSVPTLQELLEPVENRRKEFYRGSDLYDQTRVGFASDVPEQGKRALFKYETGQPGNANTGHLYGIQLSPEEKLAMVEYLKTL